MIFGLRVFDNPVMPEMRKNVVTGELVIIAPERAKRPHDAPTRVQIPSYSDTCPFCPGQEAQTPAPTYVAEVDGKWAVRVVPNKFSALSPEGEPWSTNEGLKPRGGAAGPHEVIIEGQDHGARFWGLSASVRSAVVHAWHNRVTDFYARPNIEHVVLFKNHGPAAGGSLTHPHSQIVGLPTQPGRHEHRRMISLQHRLATNRCLLCDVVAEELAQGARTVLETDAFLAFVPFAAFSPLHVWIAPKFHVPSFAALDEIGLAALEAILTPVLQAVDEVGQEPDFNLVFLSGHAEDELSHWYLSVVGRTTKAAGFELGTGMYINPSSPELQAEKLRSAAERQRSPGWSKA